MQPYGMFWLVHEYLAKMLTSDPARPKDLGFLDGSRGGLALPRRVKATPEPRLRALRVPPTLARHVFARGRAGYRVTI